MAGSRFDLARLEERLIRFVWFACAASGVVVILFILLFLLAGALPAFAQLDPRSFLLGRTWDPSGFDPAYGILPLIADTLLVTLLAMLIAVPLGIGSAVWLAELAPGRVKALIKPAIELLAGIPSVVFGFFGLVVLVTWLQDGLGIPSGETWLAGSVLLGIMALPTIISVSEDAISAVPREYREASLASGATAWQTTSRVVVPAALSGITAAVILGIGRAIGETMAVLMVTGNAAVIPEPLWNVLSPVRTLTGTIGIEMGEVPVGSLHYHALFGIAVILLAIALGVNLLAYTILGRIRAAQTGTGNGRRLISPGNAGIIKKITLVSSGILAVGFLLIAAGPLPALAACCLLPAFYFGRILLSPRVSGIIAGATLTAAVIVVLAVLAVILFDIVSNGLPAVSWEFLTGMPSDLGRSGGILPAIAGTLYLVSGAILIALPVGIGASVYLNEYTREGKLTRIVRTMVDLLNGTPSIVFGLFGFTMLVLYLRFGISLLAGQVTLSFMILPTIIRTTEEALKNVPVSVREGSLALGATKWRTVRNVVIPPALPGILTGTILSIGRAAGETAPLLFTAVVFSSRGLPASELEPVMALPYHLFILSTSVPGARENQYGTALVLLALVTGFYLVAILIRRNYAGKIRW